MVAATVTALRTGSVERNGLVMPVWCALVRTEAGLLLFDTGLHPVHVTRPEATFGRGGWRGVMTEDDGILKRLGALELGPDDIAIVVNSHLHFDHAGNNGAFPAATFVVQAAHLAFARGKPAFPGVYWDLPRVAYLPVSGEAPVAPGVSVLPVPVHVLGHQSLVVDLGERGRVVLCGDASPNDEAIRSITGGDASRAFFAHADQPPDWALP